ncbi:MAG TPA: DUF2779 domain-containing protein [Pyrinomonadaceae bacterium]|nr:DUF2779 domain-containing protein [Pyrinomonadaceae bacterium]
MPKTTKDRLTKSAYLSYLRCPQEYWLLAHQPLFVVEPYSLEYEHLRQQGYAVQQMVKRLDRFQNNATTTVDFERAFQTAELYARTDIVVTDNAKGTIDLYEIKSAASVKEDHYDDVAFQKLTLGSSGSTVDRCYVVTMNSEYVRKGEINPEELFVITDVTDQVNERLEVTAQQAKDAIAYLKTIPIPSLVDYCMANKLNCNFIKLHFPGLPDYTVFDIAFLKHEKRRELLAQEIISITDVPDDFPLSTKQRIQVRAAKSGSKIIDRVAIAKRMDAWEYPLHFLDYETFSYAIPQFDGVRPFQQMCFQYSLHTIREPHGEPEHTFFLSRGDDDPPRAMAESLRKAIGDEIGTVLVWYEAFEKSRNTEMAVMFPEHAAFFEEVNDRTRDLMKIFSDNLYIHPEFKGRTSIKKVLPVLVPKLSYASLAIGDGLTASISWYRAAKWDTMDQETRQKIFSDLELYCELDTLAMVEIYDELSTICR